MESHDHYSAAELVNEKTVNLMRWYVDKKLSNRVKKSALGRYLTADDLIQIASLKLLKKPFSRQWAATTLICRAVYFVALECARNHSIEAERKKRLREDWRPDESREVDIDVSPALSVLSDRERQVVESLYGFNGPAKLFREIGDDLGVSKQRACQLGQRALDKMREVVCK